MLKHYQESHKTFSFEIVKEVANFFKIEIEDEELDKFKSSKFNEQHFEKTKFNLDNYDLIFLQKKINKSKCKEEIAEFLELNKKLLNNETINKEKNELINKIKLSYDKLPTLEKYNSEHINCKFCNLQIKKTSFLEHIKNKHINESNHDILEILSKAQIIIGEKPKYRKNIKNKNKIKKWIENLDTIRKEDKKKKLDERYSWIKENIQSLKDKPFFEKSPTYEKIINKLYDLSNNPIFEQDEVIIISKYNEILSNLENNLPNRKQYISEFCKTIFITWDDLSFHQGKLKINPNKGFFNPIPIQGSLKILNEIKESYFQRLYRNDVYKLRFTKGSINEFVSPDLYKIKKIISARIKEMQGKLNSNLLNLHKLSQEKIVEKIYSQEIKNKFLSIPAKMLNKNDRIIALIENNNGSHEECLLFIFQRNDYYQVLWENINSNRAGYLFLIPNKDYALQISKLKKLIQSNIEFKRLNLWAGISLKKTFNINIEKYYSLIHEYENDYLLRLKKLLFS